MSEFSELSAFIEQKCGINLPETKSYLIETRLNPLMAENGCTTLREFFAKVKDDFTGKLLTTMLDAITTNETFWFRDTSTWQWFENKALPDMQQLLAKNERSRIRIWSCACSTGQEPYTMAMLIDSFCRKNASISPSQFEIIGTDLSSKVLLLARLGRYDAWNIGRGLPPEYRDRYFTQTGQVWAVQPQIKQMVQFKSQNLMGSLGLSGTFDIVFVRNVLIYFTDEIKKQVLQKVSSHLTPQSYLVLGGSESLIKFNEMFNATATASNSVYRKAGVAQSSFGSFVSKVGV